jgi:hypothetical protein
MGGVMSRETRQDGVQDLDELRLFALGRIPRCNRCPRYRALSGTTAASPGLGYGLPAAPSSCTHQVCAPLVERRRNGRGADDERRSAAC